MIVIGSDHAGFNLKSQIMNFLETDSATMIGSGIT